MMVNFVDKEERSDPANTVKHIKIKDATSETTHNHIKGMKGVVKKLENSLTESHLDQRHLLIQMHIDDIKNQNVTSQLEEARKENKQLLNILQQKCHENDAPRSQIDMSPTYSTMSVVNLQYKYEELLAKYEGLLKVMTSRDKDIQKCHKENETLTENMHNSQKKLRECEHTLKKVNELKNEKETLRLAHNQVVILLHNQCMKNEELMAQQLHKTAKPERALLLQEIQRSNKLQHENMLLKQEVACLKARSKFPDLKTHSDISEERSKSDK